jgi:hypothetical protein
MAVSKHSVCLDVGWSAKPGQPKYSIVRRYEPAGLRTGRYGPDRRYEPGLRFALAPPSVRNMWRGHTMSVQVRQVCNHAGEMQIVLEISARRGRVVGQTIRCRGFTGHANGNDAIHT